MMRFSSAKSRKCRLLFLSVFHCPFIDLKTGQREAVKNSESLETFPWHPILRPSLVSRHFCPAKLSSALSKMLNS